MTALVFGHPLVNGLAFSVRHNQVCTLDFLAVGDVGLLNFYVDGLVVHYQDGLAFFVRCGRAAAGHIAVLVNAEDSIAGNRISVGSQRLTQRVFNARLQAFNDFGLFAGHPFLHDVFVLVQDLQRRAGQFFITLGDVALAHRDVGLAVVDDQDLNTLIVLADRTGAGYLAGFSVDGEDGLTGDRVAVGSNRLNQLVLYARLQAFHIVRFGTGDPGLNLIAFSVQNLQGCARQFFVAVGDIDLADLHLGDAVLNQDHAAFGDAAGGRYLTGLVDHEGGLGGDRVAQRRHGLLQGVGLAGVQTLHFMDVLCGGPLFNHIAVLVEDLDMGAFQFFTVGNIHLADLHFSQRVFDQEHSAFGDAAGGRYLTGFIDHEGGLGGDRVAQRRHGLLQGVGLAGMQALHFMDFLRGGPLFNDVAVLVDDLDMCAFQFFTVGNIHLADLHVSDAVGNGIRPGIAGHFGDDRSLIAGNLCFRYGILNLGIVIQLDQVSPGILPAVLFIQFNSFAKVAAIRFQLNLDTLRPDTALIVVVVPDLFNSYVCCLQRIGDTGALGHLFEARNRLFIHTVNNFCRAVRAILRQFLGSELPCAVRSCLHSQGIDSLVAILDVDRDLLRQQFIAVALQVPDLLAAYGRCLRIVGILNVISGDYLAEARGHFFIHRIGDFGCAVLLVLRQIPGGEGPLVVFAGLHSQRINSFAAILDVDRDAFRHQGFIIALHIPGLLTADVHSVQRVGDAGAAYDLFEARNRFFIHGVVDLCHTVFAVHRQHLGGEAPLTVCTGLHGQGFNCCGTVLDVNRDALRQQFGAVALQVPDLLAADSCRLRNVGVCNVVSCHYLAEVGRHNFIHRVVDGVLRALLVLRQFAGRERPLVVFTGGNGQRFNNVAAILDVDRDAFRHQGFIIALHIPGLFAADLYSFQRVGDTGALGHLLEARNFFFISRVDNFGLAVCAVFRQFLGGKAPLAVVTGLHGQGFDDVVAVLDVDRDAFRQQFGAVALQVPDLLAADGCRLRNVDVRNVVSGHYLAEAGRYFFIHCISDFGRTVCFVLRQIPGGEDPLVVFAGLHSQRINSYAALLDVDRDTCGHETCVITLHIPGLLTADIRGLQRILHCIGEASVSSLRDYGCIVRNRVFSDRVVDILAAGLLRQVLPAVGPAVLSIQLDGVNLCSVSQQVDSHAFRTAAILVVAVLPDLRHIDLGLFSCMSIGNSIGEGTVFCLCDLGSVVRYRFFGDGVVDFCSVGVLGQTGPAVGPVVGCIQIDRFNLCSIGQQVHRDLGRTIAILVIAVLPDLRNTDFSFFCCMRICQGIAEVASTVLREVNGLLIAFRYRDFIDSVLDQFTLLVLVELVPLILPAVALIKCHRRADVLTVSFQLYGKFIGTDAVLIARILPDLQDRDINLIRLMAVLYGIAVVTGIVLRKRNALRVSSRHNDFIHSVLNRLAVLVLVQPCPLIAPAVPLIECYSHTDINAASLELYTHAFRLQAVLVLTVIPDLFNRNPDLFGFMRVGNGIGVIALAILDKFNLLLIAGRNIRFINTVVDQCAVTVLVQTRPVMFPAIGLIQGYRLAEVSIIFFELYDNTAGPLAILIILVCPDLFNRHLNLFGLMAVVDGVTVVARFVLSECDVLRVAAGHCGFIHAVSDGLAVLVLFKSGPLIVPVVSSIQRYRITQVDAVSLQLYAYAAGTDVILVALVEPFLFNRHFDLIGRVGIGQGCDSTVLCVSAEGVSARQVRFIPGVVD